MCLQKNRKKLKEKKDRRTGHHSKSTNLCETWNKEHPGNIGEKKQGEGGKKVASGHRARETLPKCPWPLGGIPGTDWSHRSQGVPYLRGEKESRKKGVNS